MGDDDRYGGGGGGGGGRGQGPPDISGMVTIKVDNITFDTTAEDIRDFFRGTGEIGDCYVPKNFRTQESRGFAFVRYLNRDDAERAVEKMDGKSFRGREIRCQFANKERPSDPRAAYRGRDRYDDYRGGSGGYGGGGRDRYDDRYSGGGGGRRRSRSRSPPRRRRSPSPDRRRGRDSRSRSRSGGRRRSRSPSYGR